MPTTYFPIATTTLSSTAASLTLSSIPATYTDLKIVLVSRSSNTATSREDLYITFNSDTGSNYSTTILYGQDSTAATIRQTSQARINAYTALPGTAGQFNLVTMDLLSYADSTFKSCLIGVNNNQSTVGGEVNLQVGLYRSTSPITSVTFTPQTNSFGTGSTATVYGIKNA
jgi:hypothetical protein